MDISNQVKTLSMKNKIRLPFSEEDYDNASQYFGLNVGRFSGFCAEMALYNAFNKEWEHGYGEEDIELYNAPIQVKSRLANGTKKLYYPTHQKKGYDKVRGFIFGDVFYDSNEKSGYYEIYPYVYAKEYILKNSKNLIRGGKNFGANIHEDFLLTCPRDFRHAIEEEHLIGLERVHHKTDWKTSISKLETKTK